MEQVLAQLRADDDSMIDQEELSICKWDMVDLRNDSITSL